MNLRCADTPEGSDQTKALGRDMEHVGLNAWPQDCFDPARQGQLTPRVVFWLRRPTSKVKAFTLIELLTVIAIIAILAGILIPTATGARMAANRARTRVQFAQWATAIEAFRQEYGCYPEFDASGKVNGGAAAAEGGVHPFHDLLAGRRRDGTALPASGSIASAPEAQNFRHMPFIIFSQNDLFSSTYAEAGKRSLLHDGFENTDIAVLVDINMDGVINDADYPVRPTVLPSGNDSVQLSPGEADFPPGAAGGVRAGVIFVLPT